MEKQRKIMKMLLVLTFVSAIFFTLSCAGNAWAEEWVCNDPNYPLNCNNGVCCASGYYCCHLGCCPAGSLCCPTGCCPAGYPWFCPENNRCYENYEDATVNCGSILQQCH
jgi:hypothetical protein